MRKTLYTVITALTAALAAHAADTGKIDYNTMETRWKNAYDYTPGKIHPMTNIGHDPFIVSTSCDGRYIFTESLLGTSVLDSRSMRIIKMFKSPVGDLTPHPSDPDLIYFYSPLYGFGLNSDPQPGKCILVNWKTGEVVTHRREAPELLNASDQQFLFENGRYVSIVNNPETFAGWGYPRFDTGSLAVDSKDSLLIVTGTDPMIFDLKHGVLRATLSYRRWLDINDGRYKYDPDYPSKSPKPKNWEATPGRAFSNIFGYQARFTPQGTVEMGGYGPQITEWSTDGEFIRSETVSAKAGPALGFTDVGTRRYVASWEGTFTGRGGKYTLHPEMSQTPNGYYDGQQTNVVSRPFGARGKERLLIGIVSGKKQSLILVDANKEKVLDILDGTCDITNIRIAPDESYAVVTEIAPSVVKLNGGKKLGEKKIIELSRDIFETIESIEILPGDIVACGSATGNIFFHDLKKGETIKTAGEHDSRVVSMQLGADGRRLYSLGYHGDLIVWDTATFKPLVRMNFIAPGEVYLTTPDGYYTATAALQDKVHFSRDNEAYRFDQFELRANRPDIILQRLGADSLDVAIARKAWLKRLKRRGYTPDMLSDSYHIPEAEITNKESLGAVTDNRSVTLDLSAFDAETPLRNIQLELNGVPLYGDRGLDVSGGNRWTKTVTVPLASGANQITLRAENAHGAVSLRDEMNITCTAEPETQDLYVVAVGVSRYNDATYNLTYADKDAADMSAMISGKSSRPGKVHVLGISDSEFDRTSLDRISRFFSQAGRDDALILYYAGHGVLDADLDYWLATWNMNFANPAGRGVTADEFAATMNGSQALARYIILDACHSGAFDKDDYLAMNTETVGGDAGQIVFRGAGASLKERTEEVNRINNVLQQHFVDFNTSAGAMTVSSASGTEVAMEGGDWNNGLFTYYLRQGAEKNAARQYNADSDGDGSLSFEEILEYAVAKVPEASRGRQRPTLRRTTFTHKPLLITTK